MPDREPGGGNFPAKRKETRANERPPRALKSPTERRAAPVAGIGIALNTQPYFDKLYVDRSHQFDTEV